MKRCALIVMLLLVAGLSRATIIVTASATAPTADADDPYYLPGIVQEQNAIGNPTTQSSSNDGLTYVANDRTSLGMSFTTGSNPLGYQLGSISVQHVDWGADYLDNGTWYDVRNADAFDFRIGTISGNALTPIYTTSTATYSGSAIVRGDTGGTGTYLTFDLSGATEQAGIGTLLANTLYFFEIASAGGDPYIELKSTSADGYAGGQAFVGGTSGTLDADNTITQSSGDFAFHANLAAIPEPGSLGLCLFALIAALARRRLR